MQEPIVGVQIYRRDGDVGDDGHVGLLLPDERFDGCGAFEAILSQKMTKGLFDLVWLSLAARWRMRRYSLSARRGV